MSKYTIANFISSAERIHHDKNYNYCKVKYKNSHTKVEIICKIHGSFFQRPADHIHGKNGCPKCKGGISKTQEEFIRDAKLIHGDRYDYSSAIYTNKEIKVKIICKEHGIFEMSPHVHVFMKANCQKCVNKNNAGKRRKTKQYFIEQASKVHKNRYDYSLVEYFKCAAKVKIICKEHGIFEMRPLNHVSGKQGCPICAKIRLKQIGGYDNSYFIRYPEEKNTPATLYIIQIKNQEDHFYKIGITIRNIKSRFTGVLSPEAVIIPIVENSTTLFNAFLQEQYLLKVLKPHRYIPFNKFGGHTECIKIKPEVEKLIEDHFGINIKHISETTDAIRLRKL